MRAVRLQRDPVVMAAIRELERGVWLADHVPEEVRRPVEMLCHLLSDCVADAVVTLSLFEEAVTQPASDQWDHDRGRERQREAELETQEGLEWGQPDYFERSNAIREQARRDALRIKWAEQGGPESYRRRLPFIHAQSFVSTLAQLQRSLVALSSYQFEPHESAAILQACDGFAAALPGLKGVRDSTEHAEDRVRGEARGKKLEPAPMINEAIHAPGGGVLIMNMLNGRKFGCTLADGTFAELEVSDATTAIASSAVQAVYDALPWRPGHRLHDPSQ